MTLKEWWSTGPRSIPLVKERSCGDCYPLPCLEDAKAMSLNHAYTLISSHFKTNRISHSGNVFLRGHWHDKSSKWKSWDSILISGDGVDGAGG